MTPLHARSSSHTDAQDQLLVNQLAQAKLKEKVGIIEQLSPQSTTIFEALLDSRLYFIKADKRVILVEKIDSKHFQAIDPFDTTFTAVLTKHAIKKISINNKIRQLLKSRLATQALTDENAAKRLQAVTDIYDRLDKATVATIRKLVVTETDTEVKEAMEIALAIANLNSTDIDSQMAAVKFLSGNINPVVKNTLQSIKTDNSQLKSGIEKSLASIEQKITLNKAAETVFFGLSYGSVLVLVAIGLAITFGVMGVINMAHGELVMIGAYVTYVVQTLMPNYIDISLFVAIPFAFMVSGAFGMLIEFLIVRNLKGRILETLLATFGVSLILQQLVRTIFSPLNKPVSTPSWMSGAWEINSLLSLTYNRLFIIVFCILVFVALYLIMKKTRLGLEVRAVSQDRHMASAMGVKANQINLLTFAFGSGIAGVAGVALSQLTNVGPNLGQAYIIDSFMVVVFGGVGNLVGTLVSGLSIGIASKFIEPWAGAVLAKIAILVFIILFIQKRPRGLFPQKGCSAEA